jgi:hypothetical protein
MRSRNQKPPSLSAKLKLKKYRDTKDIKPLKQKYTELDKKKLFKDWR